MTEKAGANESKSSQPQQGSENIEHGFVPDKKKKIRSEIKKLAFLDNYNKFITPAHTASAIGVSLRVFYDWIHDDPAFEKAFEVVERHLTDRMVRVATARAIKGSDNLLMFMLKSRDPKFRDKMQAELDPKIVDSIVNSLVDALRRTVPDSCPHCKTNLNLSKKVNDMLQNLSKGVGK